MARAISMPTMTRMPWWTNIIYRLNLKERSIINPQTGATKQSSAIASANGGSCCEIEKNNRYHRGADPHEQIYRFTACSPYLAHATLHRGSGGGKKEQG